VLEAVKDTNWRAHEAKLDLACTAAGAEKMAAVEQFVEDDLDTGATHICVLTHLRESAHRLAEQLEKKLSVPVVMLTGELPPRERHKAIAAAKALPSCVLVTTMHAVAEGIDLTVFTRATFAELYWQPKTIIQTLGRFSRLSGKQPSYCRIVVLEASLDEVIASTVLKKIADINKVVRAGQAEANLEDSLVNKQTDEEFLTDLRRAAESMCEDEL